MMRNYLMPVLVSLILAAPSAEAAIYSFDRDIGTDGTLSGYFETDGTIGSIDLGNIVDFSITMQHSDMNGGAVGTASLAGGQSLAMYGLAMGDLVATATDILFDFGSMAIMYAYADFGGFWCVAGNDSGCFDLNAEVVGYSDSGFASAGHTNYAGLTSIASGVSAVPLPAGLPLLLGALAGMGLIGRRKAKRSA